VHKRGQSEDESGVGVAHRLILSVVNVVRTRAENGVFYIRELDRSYRHVCVQRIFSGQS
jgi:hypothetical protein